MLVVVNENLNVVSNKCAVIELALSQYRVQVKPYRRQSKAKSPGSRVNPILQTQFSALSANYLCLARQRGALHGGCLSWGTSGMYVGWGVR